MSVSENSNGWAASVLLLRGAFFLKRVLTAKTIPMRRIQMVNAIIPIVMIGFLKISEIVNVFPDSFKARETGDELSSSSESWMTVANPFTGIPEEASRVMLQITVFLRLQSMLMNLFLLHSWKAQQLLLQLSLDEDEELDWLLDNQGPKQGIDRLTGWDVLMRNLLSLFVLTDGNSPPRDRQNDCPSTNVIFSADLTKRWPAWSIEKAICLSEEHLTFTTKFMKQGMTTKTRYLFMMNCYLSYAVFIFM